MQTRKTNQLSIDIKKHTKDHRQKHTVRHSPVPKSINDYRNKTETELSVKMEPLRYVLKEPEEGLRLS